MKSLFIALFCFSTIAWGQQDFSDNWEDFYSYNNVKDFVKVDNKIYAAADNAVFIYDVASQEIEKLSSVQGLSGESIATIYYSAGFERLVIGYETGLLEVVDTNGKITLANDIERLSILGNKQINDILEYNTKLYLATSFGIVVYDLENLQFGDTYYIGSGSSEVEVWQLEVFNEQLYAATTSGIYSADINNENLIDFNNWNQPQGSLLGNFNAIEFFNNKLYTASGGNLYEIVSENSTQLVFNTASDIKALYGTDFFLTLTTRLQVQILDANLSQIAQTIPEQTNNAVLNNGFSDQDHMYLATTGYGILMADFNSSTFDEIHPEGPTSNDVFSITAKEGNLWAVYGGFDATFTPRGIKKGLDHYNGENWINIPYNNNYPAADMVHITIDPNNVNKAYVSSWAQTLTFSTEPTSGGILAVENDEPVAFWNHTNSGLESFIQPTLPDYKTIRVNGTAFDAQGNLWVTNALVANKLKKLSPNGSWKSIDLNSLVDNTALGLTELIIDRTNTVWIGTRRNGLFAYNETGERKKALKTEATKGSLPDPNVRTVAVDRNNRIWIGTQKGLVVFSNAGGIFDSDIYDAVPVIIDDEGIAKKLLGEQTVNTIAIDGADNKWFGTETGGVLGTNPSGQETLFNFNKDNSPLPSNKIVKIQVDDTSGKVFFATEKGIVAFKNNVAPFGDELGEVYAYPNPVRKEHNTVTIDGRNGTHLPRGTNVKIVDASGRLVYETNVIEGQQVKGGKVVWNKTNLAGRKVASGVYIVLLTLPDASETTTTKIAIIN